MPDAMRSLIKRLNQSSPFFWFFLAFILRLIFALKLGNGLYQIDESGYHASALNLVKFNVFGSQTHASAGAPIPAFYFSIFLRFFGDHPLAARLGLLIPDLMLVWIMWKMAEKLCQSQLAGKIALMISSVYPFFIYYGGMMLSETPYLVFMTFGIWQLCQSLAEDGKNRARAMGSGISLALAGLSRPEGAVIMLGIWFIVFIVSRKSLRLLKGLLISFFCWLCILGSWSVRNRIETGSFALDSHGGVNLLYGTLLFDVNEQDTFVANRIIEQMPAFANIKNLPLNKQDQIYWKAAFQFMREHPTQVIRQWGRKTVNFWRFYPRGEKFYTESSQSRPDIGLKRSGLILISLLTEPFLIIFGLWGLVKLLKTNQTIYPVVLFVLATFFLHMISVSQMRYRLPVMPFLILGTSYFMASLIPNI